MVIRHDWQPVLGSELGASFDVLLTHGLGQHEVRGVGRAELEVPVVEELELLRAPEVDALPAGLLDDVLVDGPAVSVLGPIVVVHIDFVVVGKGVLKLAQLHIASTINKTSLFYFLVHFLANGCFLLRNQELKIPPILSVNLDEIRQWVVALQITLILFLYFIGYRDEPLTSTYKAKWNVEELLHEPGLCVEIL